MLNIDPIDPREVTKINCPACGERLPRVGLLKGSRVHGMTFKCKRCGRIWEITAEPESGNSQSSDAVTA